MRKNNKRTLILESAFTVAEKAGAAHITLDAVAEAANVSKGGLLYHFATKQALLAGMLEHMIDLNHERIATTKEGNALEAVLFARENMTSAEHRASQALLAAAAENTELLAPARSQIGQIFDTAIKGRSDPLAATVLLLANEGLRFLDVLNINPLDGTNKRKVADYMHQQAGEL